jgi:hypothetical protein
MAAGAALNHPVGVLLPHGVAGKRAGLAGRRPEQRPVPVGGDAGHHPTHQRFINVHALERNRPC